MNTLLPLVVVAVGTVVGSVVVAAVGVGEKMMSSFSRRKAALSPGDGVRHMEGHEDTVQIVLRQ